MNKRNYAACEFNVEACGLALQLIPRLCAEGAMIPQDVFGDL